MPIIVRAAIMAATMRQPQPTHAAMFLIVIIKLFKTSTAAKVISIQGLYKNLRVSVRNKIKTSLPSQASWSDYNNYYYEI